ARLIGGRGEIAAATALVEAELAEARAAHATYPIAFALRTYAAVSQTGDRVAVLDEALELVQGAGAARLEAQIRTDMAAWILLLHPEDSQRAVDLLRAAEKYARAEETAPLL